MSAYRRRRPRRPWWASGDAQYHRYQHQKHAVTHWGHVALGAAVVVLFLLLCFCG